MPANAPLTIGIVHVGPARMRSGNRVTALRWAGVLRELGCKVFVERSWSGRPCDTLVALHAAKTLTSIRAFRTRLPRAQLIVACAGTDVYGDDGPSAEALEGLALADRLIVFQPNAIDTLPQPLRARARVVYQSVRVPPALPGPAPGIFQVALIANLRQVKDPLSVAQALRRLPADSRVEVRHAGAALDPELAAAARQEARQNPRYRFVGELDHGAALACIATSRLIVVPSRHEGGANVLSEALALGVPPLCTRIPGSTGLVGADYAGLYPVGDEARLAELLRRAETDVEFLGLLAAQARERAWIAGRDQELQAWRELLGRAH